MIRPATRADVPELQKMVRELAEFHDSLHLLWTDQDELDSVLFGPDPQVFARLAVEEATGRTVGYILWTQVYCTWRGRAIHIDDIYIRPRPDAIEYKTALLKSLAELCIDQGFRHMEWWGMNSNHPVAEYYKAFGAEHDPDLTAFRLSGRALPAFAASA